MRFQQLKIKGFQHFQHSNPPNRLKKQFVNFFTVENAALILWIIFVHSLVTFWETRIEAVFYSYGARVYTEKLPHAHAPAIIRSRREAPCL